MDNGDISLEKLNKAFDLLDTNKIITGKKRVYKNLNFSQQRLFSILSGNVKSTKDYKRIMIAIKKASEQTTEDYINQNIKINNI